jgi:hypothetical protein
VKVNVPKIFGVPVALQTHLCEKLSFGTMEYVAQIPRPSLAMMSGGRPAEETPPPETA